MPKEIRATPEGRPEKWKKLWGTSRALDDEAANDAFEEFIENFVPSHMHKRFFKTFGVPRASFGNRFFADGAKWHPLDVRLSSLILPGETHVEAIVIYGSPDTVEAWALRGEVRRSFRDLFIDDWHAACAILRVGPEVFYAFIEPKMKGCVVLNASAEPADKEQ